MARGFKSPAEQLILPKVSFVVVQNDDAGQPAGVHDLQARSYGYNDFSEFQKPEHYIRYIEPLEKDLAIQVEYDMDEQDQEWLDALNIERKKDQSNAVSYETFEIIMDRLEKEWFDLTKNIPKPDFALPSEDSTCAICDDSEGENSNAIVFCDGCNLAVHQDCYGVPYIPEGQWLCRKCTVSPENPVSCILCPNEGGAFKQTVLGEWAHLLCAIWIPETRVANEVFMEPITGSDKIPKQRWKLKCSICGIREGACIQCTKTSCFLAFHTTCARKEKLLMPMKSTQGSEPVTLMCYCEKHLPKEQQDARLIALARDGLDGADNLKLSKSARAYAKTFKTGPPLVPQIIVDRISNYITKINVRKKSDFVYLVCKYWSLKREARRGAPLLKRLHLEPWTASNANKQQTEEEKTIKLEYLKRLRNDLETLRELTLLSRKRESRKLAQIESVHKVIETCLFPHEESLRIAFEKILALDRQGLFKHPVSKAEVPDYYDVVKTPMTWDTIDGKLDHHEYWDLNAFKVDVELVLSNAILYNKPGTTFYKAAQRIQISCRPILQDISHLTYDHPPLPPALNSRQITIGDLEPPLEALQLLTSSEIIQEHTNLVLSDDPLTSLFNYELGRLKPPPPPPPPKQPKGTKRKAKPNDPGSLDVSPGFRAPRTRRSAAAASALEAEANERVAVEERALAKPKGQKWRRGPTTLPGQSEVPPMVDDVDNQGSFKMFDAGWILPSGQRRGGRQPMERQPLPKKIRVDRGGSKLSALSTHLSDSQVMEATPQYEGSAGPSGLTVTEKAGVAMAMANESEKSVQASRKENETMRPILPVIANPNTKIISEHGRLIIEELDTPAIRREKARLRKAEKRRENAEVIPQIQPMDAVNGDESDLSSLSDLESEQGRDVPNQEGTTNRLGEQRRSFAKLPKAIGSAVVNPDVVVVKKDTLLERGTLDTYPWWPAVIYDPADPLVPLSVLNQRERTRRTDDGPLYLVQFYDKASQWSWFETNKLLLLGEDDSVDIDMLASPSSRQRWKNKAIRKDCQEAYERAKAEMETDVDQQEMEVDLTDVHDTEPVPN
ncbi:PHD-zinc-finger like domain-containing protein [Hygrophoropsis aurantiaca]|uniref:PHD-zinc-finger like domain-containing protein n=1 Tax=Hygrophoropsis aurantiaca TaxID=72124 RepID=A0ACB8AMT7_9AGAM|nr:PHD-zinc-finger like domain-containing protein [Hygrophoropsis aurantiaca]